jgi:hypothetical protein
MLPIITATIPALRIAGGAVLMGAGFCAGQYGATRIIRKFETSKPQSRDMAAQAIKIQVLNLAAHSRKLEDVLADPTIHAALRAIDATLVIAPPVTA